MTKVPYIGFGNDTLANLPKIAAGDTITCPHCGESHAVNDTTPPGILLFYDCGSMSYLAGVNGRNVVNVPADVSGSMDTDP